MIRLSVLLVCGLVPFTVLADDSPKAKLAEARKQWLKGNTGEARELYSALAKELKSPAPAVIGIARTMQTEGEYAKAIEVLETALKTDSENADLRATLAELLYAVGNWDAAQSAAEAVLKTRKNSFRARWVTAQILRDRGKVDEADEAMRWFIRTYSDRSQNDDDIKDPDQLLIVGQAGTERARFHHLSEQFKFILNELYVDAIKLDKQLWQAEYLSGMMLLEKYNRPEAIAAFDNALKINPRAAEAFVGKGVAALQTFELKDAELFVDQALKINPRLTAALRLKADIHLIGGNLQASLKTLEDALQVNPREEATLARKAAILHIRKDAPAFQAVVAEVEKNDAKPGAFYYGLAVALEERKIYLDAEKYYRKAIELHDRLPGPKTGLGMLYMRLGKEKEARELLNQSFEADPFNIRVANSRKVLKHLELYRTKETAHYILKYDPKHDPILAEFFAEYLEQIHGELAKEFGYEPAEKVLVELFSSHEMFSGRTVALPDLHTIGACSGRVVTICSPAAKDLGRAFNWGRVLRHELVHIFNLAQTDFLVPHWLTEGLAVRNERMGRPPSWSRALREAHDRHELLSLETIQLGFVRPRNADQWALAYCQSQLYVDYLAKTAGGQAIGKMLNAYHEGLGDAAAIQKVCGIDKATFEKGYLAYLEEVVRKIPANQRKTDKPMTLTELEKALDKNPEDFDAAARLASEYLQRRRTPEARKLVDKVLAAKPGHALASIIKARLLLAAGDREAAVTLLETAVKENPEDEKVSAALGRLFVEAKEWAKAATLYERCRELAPTETEPLIRLAEVYTQLKKQEELATILRELASQDSDDLKTRIQLAQLLLDLKRPAEAESVARDAMQIDVLSEPARKALITALKQQKKADEAEKIAQRFDME